MTTNPTPEDLLANLKANPHPKQTHLEMAGGYAYITVDGHKIAYDGEHWFGDERFYDDVQLNLLPLHQEIDRVLVRIKNPQDKLTVADTKEQTPSWEQIKSDCVGPDLPTDPEDLQPKRSWVRVPDGMTKDDVFNTEPTFVSTDRYRELEERLKTVTEERDAAQKKNDLINGQMSDLLAERETLFAKIDRLKFKAGLLSVVCRRLYDSEEVDPTILHRALDHVDNQRKALDYIGEKVGADPDPTVPNRLRETQANVAQAVKSLGEKTVENAKLQEGLKNYKAHVDGLTKRLEQMTFERDTERVGNKWLSETVEDLKRTTVKLPNEHTLRRLFNRHNTPQTYRNGEQIPTMERLLILIEGLESSVSVQTRRAEHMALVNCQHEAMISDTHALLDEHGVQSYAGETYLGIPARIRQLFQTHTKV